MTKTKFAHLCQERLVTGEGVVQQKECGSFWVTAYVAQYVFSTYQLFFALSKHLSCKFMQPFKV